MGIDSHVHFWKYDKQRYPWITGDMKLLKQDYLPEHLALTLKRNHIDACIAVQADDSELDTRFLTELAATHPEIKGVVGWIDFENPQSEEKLAFFSQYPVIKGWRYGHLQATDDFLLTAACKKTMAALQNYNYSFDLLLRPAQLAQAVELAALFPDQPFVLNHCGKPAIATQSIYDWKKQIQQLAAYPNVHCKLSGLFTETNWKNWSAADFFPWLDVVFEAFGTHRLLFGSDWPVLLLSGMYVQWKSLLEKYMEAMSEEDRQRIFGENAAAFYRL
jgi:L-fuconolactonase